VDRLKAAASGRKFEPAGEAVLNVVTSPPNARMLMSG
jgi:hypothetical protein